MDLQSAASPFTQGRRSRRRAPPRAPGAVQGHGLSVALWCAKRRAADGREPTMKESQAARRDRAGKINDILKELFPEADCPLDHADPVQLLIAPILSAQCTDARVNMV